MDPLTAIANWLRSTIPGIIILGALGSGVFALFYWFAKSLIGRWLPSLKKRIYRFFDRWVDVGVTIDMDFERRSRSHPIVVYFATHTTLAILGSLWGIYLLDSFLSSYSRGSKVSPLSLTLLAGSFFCIGISLKSLGRFLGPYTLQIDSLIEQAKKDYNTPSREDQAVRQPREKGSS